MARPRIGTRRGSRPATSPPGHAVASPCGQDGPIDHLASHDDQVDRVVSLHRLQRISPEQHQVGDLTCLDGPVQAVEVEGPCRLDGGARQEPRQRNSGRGESLELQEAVQARRIAVGRTRRGVAAEDEPAAVRDQVAGRRRDWSRTWADGRLFRLATPPGRFDPISSPAAATRVCAGSGTRDPSRPTRPSPWGKRNQGSPTIVHSAYRFMGDVGVGATEMIGYDADRKTYRTWFFDNQGHTEERALTVQDNTWTWTGEKTRSTGTLSDDGLTMQAQHERTEDGGPGSQRWT
jgi:hypothetical protein